MIREMNKISFMARNSCFPLRFAYVVGTGYAGIRIRSFAGRKKTATANPRGRPVAGRPDPIPAEHGRVLLENLVPFLDRFDNGRLRPQLFGEDNVTEWCPPEGRRAVRENAGRKRVVGDVMQHR